MILENKDNQKPITVLNILLGGVTMCFEIKDNALFINDIKLCIPSLCFIDKIGKGGNAKVFLAHNNLLDRNEAVKVWIPKKTQKVVDETRFVEEVRKNAKASFPNVASFYDANIENGIYYARLEYIPGRTLNDFLLESKSFLFRQYILKTILETMILVYKEGYYHGDLHAGNIIISKYKPYIIDFGTSFFSGVTASQKRDCRMLVKLCFEVLPELRKLEFIDDKRVIGQGSKIAVEFLLRCLLIIWDFENNLTSDLDSYTYKEWQFCFYNLLEDFSFLDVDAVNNFFAENYSIRTIT